MTYFWQASEGKPASGFKFTLTGSAYFEKNEKRGLTFWNTPLKAAKYVLYFYNGQQAGHGLLTNSFSIR